jgi:hypothetical protein
MDFKIDNVLMQPGNAEAVPSLASADYEPTNFPFVISNEGSDTVTLEVKYANGTAWVTKKFTPGWNPDQLKAIKTNATAGISLLRSL